MIEIATSSLQEAAAATRDPKRIVTIYRWLWQTAVSRELRAMKLLRRLFAYLGQKHLERAAALIGEDLSVLLNGDMDRQSTLIPLALKRPAASLYLSVAFLAQVVTHGIVLKSEQAKRVM